MLVDIYHADPADFDCERDAREFPKGYTRIATLSVRDLDEAYELSQNTMRPWLTGSAVKLRYTATAQARSTSCGDLLFRPTTRQLYRVVEAGFDVVVPTQAPPLLEGT